MQRPVKHPDLLAAIRTCVQEGRYLDSRHALERQLERMITRPEVLHVLIHGYHEAKKDQFDDSGMLLITAIDLSK